MTGEERAQRIEDDLLQLRLIAASIQDRRGRPRKEHPIFSEPDEIAWLRKKPEHPLFMYGERGAFAVDGDVKKPLLIECQVRGPITWRKVFDPLGQLRLGEGFPEGKSEWN
jgi:hypothetical protein